MTTSTTRDATVILRDHTDYVSWVLQIQAQCVACNLWDKVDPAQDTQYRQEPKEFRVPQLTNYPSAAGIGIPERVTELTPAGQRNYREDIDHYKLHMEQHKNDRNRYDKEQSNILLIVRLIQSTVTPHLRQTCCLPGEPLRTWLTNLKYTVGLSDLQEMEQARDRYLAALKPMRTPGQWDTWLAEYDQAATEAERNKVPETSLVDVITKDFIVSVHKIAPIWTTNFQDNGRSKRGMTRKEMMSRFREYMMMHHPLRAGKHKAAFAAYDNGTSNTTLSGGPQPLPGTPRSGGTVQPANLNPRDASLIPGNPSQTKYRGRPRKQRASQATRQPAQKRTLAQSEGATSGQKCPACYQHHELRACYYVNPDLAPEWWTPNEAINELVQFKRSSDSTLQGLMRGQSRSRTRTPAIKLSDTSEADESLYK
ncbi:hypothetical protein P3342_004567 [Pyrenophora teres f. teres]|nr:hypothetical protein P3342_004567 [Pyrenophora teres f. teres]